MTAVSPDTAIRIIDRPLANEQDALRLRQFLIDTYALVGREFNWETRRWEGTYWYRSDADWNGDRAWQHDTHLWETAVGQIVGAAIPDGPGDVGLQVHPHFRQVEDAILEWAEAHMAHNTGDGQRHVMVWTFDWDTDRIERLQRHGYQPRDGYFWHNRRRKVSDPVPEPSVAAGYTIRSLRPGDLEDTKRWRRCSSAVFKHSGTAPDTYANFQSNAPSYNHVLHLVAEAPDGEFAAFAGLTVDPHNRYATFEPVGTHPDHRRKGLASAVMCEGLRRLQARDLADVVYVANWGTSDAAKLYASVGLVQYATNSAWVKNV